MAKQWYITPFEQPDVIKGGPYDTREEAVVAEWQGEFADDLDTQIVMKEEDDEAGA